MEKHKRINPKITDLDLKESSKIFQFLMILLDRKKLDIDYFVFKFNKFSIAQQYFIIKYASIYFDLNNTKSLLSKHILTHEEHVENEDEWLLFLDYESKISNNSAVLLNKIKESKPTVYNRYRYYLKHGIKSVIITEQPPIGLNKIPVFYNQTEFKQYFFSTLESFYTLSEVNQLYNNSFRISDKTFPPNLLYLHIRNSEKLYSAIYSIYKYRYKEVTFKLKVVVANFNAARKKQREKRNVEKHKSFISDIEEQNVSKYDFMCCMYNAFPQIRDSYKKAKLKSSDLTIESYLKTKSRNLHA